MVVIVAAQSDKRIWNGAMSIKRTASRIKIVRLFYITDRKVISHARVQLTIITNHVSNATAPANFSTFDFNTILITGR